MQKTRLYRLLSKLSSWDLTHFEAFLKSPYFNKRKDVILLFNYLRDSTDKQLHRSTAFQFVYPEKPYSDKETYLLISYLYKLLEDFLAFQQIKKNKVLLKSYTAKTYNDLKLEQPFSLKLNESRSILKKSKLRNSTYLQRIYELEKVYYDYLGSSQRSTENNLEQVDQAFDAYYIAEKIRYHCFQLSHKAVFEKEYKTDMLDAVISVIEQDPKYLELPPIAIYYNYYKALTSEYDEVYFKTFRQNIDAYKQHFTFTEIRDIYLAAINFCIRRANRGGSHYVEEMFELYKTGIEQGAFVENDEISPFAFTNILSTCIKLKELEWLENFIEKYQSMLNPKVRDSIVQYSIAALRYEQKKYTEAMQLLARFDADDQLLVLSAKTIQLKIFYELDELEALDALLESMRIYLQRKRNMGYHKEVYQNVIRLTKKLMALPPYDKKKKDELQKRVAVMQPQSLREWFADQLFSI